MKKTFFKSVVATAVVTAAMALSSVAVFADTATVTAESDGSWSVDADDFYYGEEYSTDAYTAPTYNPVYAVDYSDSTSKVATIEVTSGTKKFYYQKYGTRSSSLSGDTNMTLYTSEMRASGDRTITVTPTVSGNVTAIWYASDAKEIKVGTTSETCTAKTITKTSCATPADSSVAIVLASNYVLLEITFEPCDVTAYTWELDTGKLSNVTGDNVGLASYTTYNTTSNTLTYSGDDYDVAGDYVTLTAGETSGVVLDEESNTITVTPQDGWFEEVVKITPISTTTYIDFTDLGSETYAVGDVVATYLELDKTGSTSATPSAGSGSNSYGNLTYTKKFNSGSGKIAYKFVLEKDALVQVVYQTSKTDTANERAASIYTSTSRTAVTNGTVTYTSSTSDGSTASLGVINAQLTGSDEGTTYYIIATDDSDTISLYSINVVVGAELKTTSATIGTGAAAVYVNGDNAYVIAAITATEAAGANTLKLSATTGSDSTDTVYDTVCVDDDKFVFTASDVSTAEDAAYVYALKLTGATGKDVATDLASVTVGLE